MTDPVDWALAERIAVRVSGREPFAESYHYASLEPDFAELTAEAEELVYQATGLRSLAGPARARVTDRAGWVGANVASFSRLLRPLTERLGERVGESALAPLARRATGAELGLILGWMSTRVLGQYDLLVIEEENPDDQDVVYYVGPNVIALEKRFAFPPREFRLWLALHEVTHRAQFTGVPWLREHFLSLVERSLDAVDPDPKRFVNALRRWVESSREGRNPLEDGGLVALLASPEQGEVLRSISGMMSLLEGHGDVTMDRAGQGRIPSAERFSRVLHQRRQTGSPGVKLLQRLLGLEAKFNQYEQGERFIHAVEAVGGSGTAEPRVRGAREPAGSRRDPRPRRVDPPRRGRGSCQGLTAMATILVVDDEPDIRLLTKLNLERDGHTIVTATDGEEALDAVRDAPPDLIVLDVMMPKVDGWAVLEQLKSALDKPITEIPVIVVTALGGPMDRVKGGIEGAVQYLTKPMDLEALRAAVTDALAEPEPPQRRKAQHHALEMLARIERNVAPTDVELGAPTAAERARTRHGAAAGRAANRPCRSARTASPRSPTSSGNCCRSCRLRRRSWRRPAISA